METSLWKNVIFVRKYGSAAAFSVSRFIALMETQFLNNHIKAQLLSFSSFNFLVWVLVFIAEITLQNN